MKRKRIATVIIPAVLSVLLLTVSTVSALVEPGWIGPNIPQNPGDGFIDFEEGTDGEVITSQVPGVVFSTTMGLDWIYGDWRTGSYNGKYPAGAYTSNGYFFAWLGTSGDAGRIDFTEGTATYLSGLVSTASGVTIDAYDSDDNLLATSGWASANINTGTMTRLTVEAPSIAYVIVHDTGNYFLIDDICTDAPGVPSSNIPEFPTVAIPVLSMIGLLFFFDHRKQRKE